MASEEVNLQPTIASVKLKDSRKGKLYSDQNNLQPKGKHKCYLCLPTHPASTQKERGMKSAGGGGGGGGGDVEWN